MKRSSSGPTFTELFTPKLITVFREGYGADNFRADAVSGLTVAIVALPLSMAIAIASGVEPDKGLITAVVGGFIVSALGGSRFQIGGPAGAFIVLVAATVERHGVDGLILATLLAGAMLMVMGFLRLGAYVKYIPYPVTVGFTAGIAIIIFASQIHEFFGLTLNEAEPAALIDKLRVLSGAADTVSVQATGIAILTVVIIVALRRWRPGAPDMLIAVVTVAVITWAFKLPIETIDSRFGGIPHGLSMPTLPDLRMERILAVLPDAAAFALLGAIESLLSAVVADGMSGRRHRSNCELVAQGAANIGSSLFGGICVTGTIARTATNVRAGAHGPISGMMHAAYLLVFLYVAAPLAGYIPLAGLAGVLAVVAWNMIERNAIAVLLRSSIGDTVVLLTTLLLVVFRDLTEGIVVGFALGAILFIHRMGKTTAIDSDIPLMIEDTADDAGDDRVAYDASEASNPGLVTYRSSGAFFFGAASTVESVLDRIADQHSNFVLDCTAVPLLDSTGANIIAGAVRKASRSGVRMFVAGASPGVRHMLMTHGVRSPVAEYRDSIDDVVREIKRDAATARPS